MSILYTGNDTDGVSANANGQFWIVQGNETVSNAAGVGFNFGTFNNVTLVVEGTITSSSDAIRGTGGDYNTIIVKKDASVIGQSDGMELTGDSFFVVNHGLIKSPNDNGLEFLNDGGSLSNFGKIVGSFSGLYGSGDSGAYYNDGIIKATTFGAYLSSAGGGMHLENDGKMIGDVGVYLTGGGTHQISNNGVIEGRSGTAIQGDSGVQNIYNSGDIIGDVELGAGNDYYNGRGGSTVDGFVFGGDNSDSLRGGKANDKLKGDAGSDSLFGGKGNDKLWGGTESDYFEGGKGNDILRGEDGNDWIAGQQGNDKMFGGAGADDFFFNKSNEGNDKIMDWEDGSDQIWLQYGAFNQTRFLNRGITTDGANIEIDLAYAGAEGIITIVGAAGSIGADDFVFI